MMSTLEAEIISAERGTESGQPKSTDSRKLCWFFDKKGGGKRGEACAYRHERKRVTDGEVKASKGGKSEVGVTKTRTSGLTQNAASSKRHHE